MTALTQDRNTLSQRPGSISVLMAANVTIYAGALVAINASGFGVPGTIGKDLNFAGRAEETVSNVGGANGAKRVDVRRHLAFKWVNDGSITQAHFMKSAYIVDDQTVAATDGTATRSIAGRIVGIDSDGVWVE